MTTPWYDTREGLESRLEKEHEKLEGLHEIAGARRRAGYARGERMQDWCLLGLFWLDSCGNFMPITEGAPKHGYPYWAIHQTKEDVFSVPNVLSREEMSGFTNRWSSSIGGAGGLPPLDAVCDRCGDGWTIRNIEDYYGPQREGDPHRHKQCQILALVEREQNEFRSILERSEIPFGKMVTIPNGYHPNPDSTYYGPWFLVETPKGFIRMGWRKRVISIDWERSTMTASGEQVVDEPRVTHWKKGVHCWGADKAVEALRKLWNHG